VAAIRSASAGVIASIGLAWACGGARVFACNDDPQCTDGGELGRCETSGYCSFADETCASGWRYGARAPSELAEACVPPEDATSVAESTDDSDPTNASTTATTGTPPDSTSSTSVTTTPVDPTTSSEVTSATTAMPTSESTANGESEAESTTMIEPMDPPCVPTFVDAFDDETLDPFWQSWATTDSSVVVSGGHLAIAIAASPAEGVWSDAGVYSEPVSMLGGHVRAQLIPFAPPLDVVGVWLTLVDPDGCELQIAAWDGMIIANSSDMTVATTRAEIDAPLWLQLRVDSESTAYWEWSTDGEAWNELHSEFSACDMTSAWTALFAGDEHQHAVPIVREVESFERCEAR
jgi:hypothetical protein